MKVLTFLFVLFPFVVSAGSSALVSPETLKVWISDGYKTDNGKRVVIIDVANADGSEYNFPEDVPGKPQYIPGAVNLPKPEFDTIRSDGPVNAVTSVIKGEKIDSLLQKAGIDKNTVIVLTGTWSGTESTGPAVVAVVRTWWVLRYWGFTDYNLKLLDGGDRAYAALGEKLTDSPATPKAMNFSVRELNKNNIDAVRAPIGELVDDIKNGAYTKKEKFLINTLQPTYRFTLNDGKNINITKRGILFSGRVRGSIQLELAIKDLFSYNKVNDTFRFKTAEELSELFLDKDTEKLFLPADKSKRIITHCGTGQFATYYDFVLRNILQYTNTAVYDGSIVEWTDLGGYTVKNRESDYVSYTGHDPVSYVTWDDKKFTDKAGKDVSSNITPIPSSNPKWDTTKFTDYIYFRVYDDEVELEVNAGYLGDGREVNKEDKAYLASHGSGATH
jgi:3-mercaptopyruvate sulfurtransferase SseA